MGIRREAAQAGVDTRRACLPAGRRSEDDEGILNNMSSRPNKRNAVDMPACAAAVEIPLNLRVKFQMGYDAPPPVANGKPPYFPGLISIEIRRKRRGYFHPAPEPRIT